MNPQEKTQIEILKTGKEEAFWKILVDVLKESKEFIQKQMDDQEIQNLGAEQYKFTNELYKAKKQYLDMLMKTPDNLISFLEKPPIERTQNFDPY